MRARPGRPRTPVAPELDDLDRGALGILGRGLTDSERALFAKYLNVLLKWQKTQRLVGSDDPTWIVENLFLDSLLFLRVLPTPVRSLLDLGSGAGLPGIPLKIVRGDLELVLVESRRRRASFLSAVMRELALADVRVIAERVEDHLAELAGRFDAVVMRCAGEVNELLPLGGKLVARGGVVVASGPPNPRALATGEWVEVEGLKPGITRRFAVYRPT